MKASTTASAAGHPLQYRWVLWFLKGGVPVKFWESTLMRVGAFDTVEEFWALYKNIQPASGLANGNDYYLFKEGIRPMWEDEHNMNGGRWVIDVGLAMNNRRGVKLDEYWLELMMVVIGEQFGAYGDDICGIVLNIRRKSDRLALWTRDSTRDEANAHICRIVRERLGIPDSAELIHYQPFGAALTGSADDGGR